MEAPIALPDERPSEQPLSASGAACDSWPSPMMVEPAAAGARSDDDVKSLPAGSKPPRTETKAQRKARQKAEREATRREFWAAKRKQRRQREKEKKRVLREQGLQLRDSAWFEKQALRLRSEEELDYAGRIVLDCSFEALMTDRDLRSLGLQLQFMYAANLRAPRPFRLYATSWGGRLADVMATRHKFDQWKLTRDSRHYMQVFDPSELVYLTSESDVVLSEFDPDKAYIIGGLVDHNRHKGYTFEKAKQHGIATAQLPIGGYVQLATRKVLAVNHVFDICLQKAAGSDWPTALAAAIPARKGATSKKANVPTAAAAAAATADSVSHGTASGEAASDSAGDEHEDDDDEEEEDIEEEEEQEEEGQEEEQETEQQQQKAARGDELQEDGRDVQSSAAASESSGHTAAQQLSATDDSVSTDKETISSTLSAGISDPRL